MASTGQQLVSLSALRLFQWSLGWGRRRLIDVPWNRDRSLRGREYILRGHFRWANSGGTDTGSSALFLGSSSAAPGIKHKLIHTYTGSVSCCLHVVIRYIGLGIPFELHSNKPRIPSHDQNLLMATHLREAR